jgi:hypothetical protein
VHDAVAIVALILIFRSALSIRKPSTSRIGEGGRIRFSEIRHLFIQKWEAWTASDLANANEATGSETPRQMLLSRGQVRDRIRHRANGIASRIRRKVVDTPALAFRKPAKFDRYAARCFLGAGPKRRIC